MEIFSKTSVLQSYCAMIAIMIMSLLSTNYIVTTTTASAAAESSPSSSSLSSSFSTLSSSSLSSSSSSTSSSLASDTSSFRKDIFNSRRLRQLGTRGQWLLRHIAMATHSCGTNEMPSMRRKLLRKSHVTCNDGSPAGYYIRRAHGSDKWIVFLEGGWYCFDHKSCSERMGIMPDYMSSRKWPRYRSGRGILSWDPDENPYYFHSNVVYIPYCSSDSWSGTKNQTSPMDFSFMGSLILDEVFSELLKKGLKHAKTVVIAGSSAGGTGVLINIDRIADLIHSKAKQIDVRGVVDSGWFLDKEPFVAKPCLDAFSCSPMEGIQKGTQLWKPRLPKSCVGMYKDEIWRCYFGHRVYPTIKSPVYIVQNLYDAAQIKVSNVFEERSRHDLTSEQWRYLLQLGEDVKGTLSNSTAVFASACVSHEILTLPEWHTVRIEGTSLPESIFCWESSGGTGLPCHNSGMDFTITSKNDTPLADAPPTSTGKRRKRKGKRRRRKKNKKKRRKNKRRNNNNNKRNYRSVIKRCPQKLMDKCPWPHCNCSCPKCRWETMTEVNHYFLRTLATVMGIDPNKMANIRLCGY